MSAIWSLTKSQLEYVKFTLFFLWLAILCLGLPIALLASEIETVSMAWRVLMAFGGAFMASRFWYLDLKERRLLTWMLLPISPWALGVVRIALPLVLQIFLLTPFLISSLFLSAPHVGGSSMSSLWIEILAIQGLILIVVTLCYLVEELCLVLSRWRWAIVLFNLALGVPTGWFLMQPEIVLSSFFTWHGIGITHGAVGLLAAVTVGLFTRRRSYLMGINPWHGMPVDWTRE